VLKDIGFTIQPGEAVALIGANGTGKSTLLRCCLRLIEPDAGTVSIMGQEVGGLPRRSMRRLRARIGFVFQKHNLVPRLSAVSNVLHGALGREGSPRYWFHGVAPKAARDEALDCLAQVGLADIAERRVDRLSGGQSQRVAIARALMQRPEIVIADEPAASLDPNAGEEVMGLFRALMREKGITLFFTSHNLSHAVGYADRVIGLRDGRVALDAAAAGLRIDTLRGLYD
jgi:phosphonate transport system ATP-binding protein